MKTIRFTGVFLLVLAALMSFGAGSAKAAETISFTGMVADAVTNYPNAGIAGVSVYVRDNLSIATTTDGDGGFLLSGIQPTQPFCLIITKDGYTPVYSAFYSYDQDITALLPFGLFPAGQLAAWGVSVGNGMIFGRVTQQGNPTGYLSGATVTAVDANNQSTTFPVEYLQENMTFGGTQTTANGVFAVRNVPEDTTVRLTVVLAGYNFLYSTADALVVGGTITEESFFGTPTGGAGGGISFTGKVTDKDDAPLAGVQVHQVGHPEVTTNTAADGTFTLTGLPSGTTFSLRMAQINYTDTFSANFNTTADIDATARSYTLFPMGQIATWGAAPGIIRSRVYDQYGNTLAGAVVTAVSQLGNSYTVCYDDACTPGLTVTAYSGRYAIKNVANGDTVTVAATRTGMSIPSRVFATHVGGISQGSLAAASGSPAGISVTGMVEDTSNAGLSGVAVSQVGNAAATTITVGVPGYFTLTGLPSGTPFSLAMTQAGHATTYTPNFTTTTPITTASAFTLFTTDEYNAWGVTAGKGIIRSRVYDQAGNSLAGTVVTASSQLGNTYTICYDDACTPAYTATQNSGRYIVRNVADGDTVTVSAQKAGMTFNNPRVFATHAGGVSQGRFVGMDAAESAVQAGLSGAIAAYNAQDLTAFMGYVSDSYLDNGADKTAFQADISAQMGAVPFQSMSYVIQSTTVDGENAVITLVWNGVDSETLYFKKEGADWKLFGDQQLFETGTNSGYSPLAEASSRYWVNIWVQDNQDTITGVHVTGPGLAVGGIDLNHDVNDQRWVSWAAGDGQNNLNPEFGQSKPSLPLNYSLTIQYGIGGAQQFAQSLTVNGFQDTYWAQNVSPVSGAEVSASDPLVFSWDALPDGYAMGVELENSTGDRIWERYDFTGTSAAYDGQALDAGAYTYHLTVRDAADNYSLVSTNFTVLTEPAPIIVNFNRFQVTDSGTAADDHPDWRQDGSKIAFDSNRSGNYNIWAVNPDGSGLDQLTDHTGYVQAQYPSWSPDGAHIAYIVKDADPSYGGWGRFYLYTMNADGSGQTPHPLPPSASQNAEDTFWEFEMKFTAWQNATNVIFVSYGPVGGSFKIYRYNLSDAAVAEITPAGEANPMGDIYKISWNADLGKLAYDRWPIGIQSFTPGGADLAVMDIPGIGEMDTPAMPGWNSEATKMAFVKNLYGDDSNIAIYEPASGTTTINQTTQNDRWPVWAPGGAQMVIVSGPEYPPNGSIWLLTIEAAVPGDINADGEVDLTDVALALKVMAGMNPAGVRANYPASGADVNGDGKIGLSEIGYILQSVATTR